MDGFIPETPVVGVGLLEPAISASSVELCARAATVGAEGLAGVRRW
jgi:hypothetical protein